MSKSRKETWITVMVVAVGLPIGEMSANFAKRSLRSAYFTVNVKHGVLRSMVGTAGGSASTTRKTASNLFPSLMP
jgi:hypothetical protein